MFDERYTERTAADLSFNNSNLITERPAQKHPYNLVTALLILCGEIILRGQHQHLAAYQSFPIISQRT